MQCAARTLAARAPADRSRRAVAALAAALTSLLLLFSSATLASDRIAVSEAKLSLAAADGGEPAVLLDADFDFTLPPALEDAVRRGIPLYFVIEFELYRTRWYWFDRQLAQRALSYRLTYSPLTRQYRLARGTLALPFDTIEDALAAMRRVRGWPVLERATLRRDANYHAQLRMRLDTSQLPRPFQINALTDRDWTLASDWRSVEVAADLAR